MTNTNIIEAAIPRHASGLLMSLVIVLLAPVFLGVTGGDVDLARLAARETVNDYRVRNHADLVAVAQIIAFGLAALGSLSLSMADEISLSMTLRLRGNAVACNRSAEQNRRALAQSQVDHDAPHQAEPEPNDDGNADVDMFLSAAAAQELTAEADARLQGSEQSEEAAPTVTPANNSSQKRQQEMWAIAMVKESGEISASIPNLPPAEREAATMRAGLLSTTAHDLLYGQPRPPLSPGALAGITPPTLGDPARP